MPSFDWYQASVLDSDESEIMASLKSYFELSDIKKGRPLYGYQEAIELVRGDIKICTLMWGQIDNPSPHIIFTSREAIEGANFLRTYYPNHKVSRFDSAMDWYCEGAWDLLSETALQVAREFNISVQHVGDFERGEKGRTLYLGSKSSPVFVCLYEKGKQPDWLPMGYTDWVRLEVRVRPSSKSKKECATITPPEVFGCARWTQELFKRLTTRSVPRFNVGTIHKPSDDDRAFQALVKQYGALIVRQCITSGSDAFVKRLLSAVNFDCPF